MNHELEGKKLQVRSGSGGSGRRAEQNLCRSNSVGLDRSQQKVGDFKKLEVCARRRFVRWSPVSQQPGGRDIMKKLILVGGAGGFIGGHLVKRLKREGHWVRGVDLKYNEFSPNLADEFIIGDLRDPEVVRSVLVGINEVYQLAADMGGAGYIFTGEHDAAVMHNSATINLNVLEFGRQARVRKYFYSSSACIYPSYNQTDPD